MTQGHRHISGWAQAFLMSILHGKPHWQCTVLQARPQSPPRSPSPPPPTHAQLACDQHGTVPHTTVHERNTDFGKYTPTIFKVCPCDLFTVIAKAGLHRELQPAQRERHACVRGCDAKAWYAHNLALCRDRLQPLASMTRSPNLVTIKRVPLAKPPVRFRSKMMGHPTRNNNLCGGTPEKFRLFKNSVGYNPPAFHPPQFHQHSSTPAAPHPHQKLTSTPSSAC